MFDSIFYQNLINDLDEGVIFLDHERKIRFWSAGAEKLTGFTHAEAAEAGCISHCMRFAGLEAIKACNGVCNIHIAMDSGNIMSEDIYFQHKEGHRIPVNLRLVPFRPEISGKVQGIVEILRDNSHKVKLSAELEDLKKMALIDPLTEIGNRRYADININSHLETFKRYGTAFGLIFLDIDDFKSMNDAWGHNAGDRVIRMIGRTLHYNLRPFDLSARWGGEEFIAIILNVNLEQLLAIAEKIRHLIETSLVRFGSVQLKATVSIGATLVSEEDNETGLINRADAAMYESKKSGKNRVTIV